LIAKRTRSLAFLPFGLWTLFCRDRRDGGEKVACSVKATFNFAYKYARGFDILSNGIAEL
jgi:hypothetical protein